jgi:endonuclease-3 related protein
MSHTSVLPQIGRVPNPPTHGPGPDPDASRSARKSLLHFYFDALFAAYGPQDWWPGRSRFEVIVGAILTQNTSWKNVEQAIANLRRASLLSPLAIRSIPVQKLARHIRPSGYFRQKAKTLKGFVAFLFASYAGSLDRLLAMPTVALRGQLLALRGIGPETADSILLYAGKHPVFVVDAYLRRILERHSLLPAGFAGGRTGYEQVRSLLESELPADSQLFNEFHALIVRAGKQFCHKRNPACSDCALKTFLPGRSPFTPLP